MTEMSCTLDSPISMKIIPAIYIQKARVVSLYKGTDNSEKKVYQKAAKTYAELFSKQGATTLFVIDLDGDQQEKLKEIKEVFPGDIWWAGSLRSIEAITWLLSNGASRVVLGKSAKSIYKESLETYGPDKIMAGLQVQHYEDTPEFCETLGQYGFTELILKDMNREGTLFQPNFDLMEKCIYFSSLKIYSSGGLTRENDLELLRRAGVEGVIAARAFYENQLSLEFLIDQYSNE